MGIVSVAGTLEAYGSGSGNASYTRRTFIKVRGPEGLTEIKSVALRHEMDDRLDTGIPVVLIVNKALLGKRVIGAKINGDNYPGNPAAFLIWEVIIHLLFLIIAIPLSFLVIGIPLAIYSFYKLCTAPMLASEFSKVQKANGISKDTSVKSI